MEYDDLSNKEKLKYEFAGLFSLSFILSIVLQNL